MRVTRSQLERYQKFSNVFSTEDGKWVLEHLEKDYIGGCFTPGDHYATLHKSALRDFVDYLKEQTKKIDGPLEIEEDE